MMYVLKSVAQGTPRGAENNGKSLRKKGAYRFDTYSAKPSVLRVCIDMDPLSQPQRRGAEAEAPVRLPSLVGGSGAPPPPQGCRLWHTGRTPTRVGQVNTLVPTDSEFKEWLTLPKARDRDRAPRTGAGSAASAASAQSSPAPPASESPRPGAEDEASVDAASTTFQYHLILSGKTYDDDRNTPARVTAALSSVLDVSQDVAEASAVAAQDCRLVLLAAFDSQVEASKRAQKLRSKGLLIQVTSTIGLPPGRLGHRRLGPKNAKADRSYGDVIQESLRGTVFSGCRQRSVPPVILPEASPRTVRRRREMSEISVLPEDAVGALLAPVGEIRDDVRRMVSYMGESDDECRSKREVNAMSTRMPSKQSSGTARCGASDLPSQNNRGMSKTMASLHCVDVPQVPVAEDCEGDGVESEDSEELDNEESGAPQARTMVAKSTTNLAGSRRDNGHLMRFVVFAGSASASGGQSGLEAQCQAAKERDQVRHEIPPQKEAVYALMVFWKQVDADASGRADHHEFREVVEARTKELLNAAVPEWVVSLVGCDPLKESSKFAAKLADKLIKMALGKKSSVSLEDITRIVFPLASRAELNRLKKAAFQTQRNAQKARVKTPPALEPQQFEDLCSVFHYFDDDGSGDLTLEELAASGLIYEDQVEAYTREWDRTGDGHFDVLEFTEMMCPFGYRAYPDSKVGSHKDGTKVVWDGVIQGWRACDEKAHEPSADAADRAEGFEH